MGHGGRDSCSSGGRDCFYRVFCGTIFQFIFSHKLKQNGYLEKVIPIASGALESA